jgi:hypothetical protein
MKFSRVKLIFFACLILAGLLSIQILTVQADRLHQIPTVSIPTVTGTPPGAIAIVTMDMDQINVRGGPGTDYAIVGVLIAGQQVPALGRSPAGEWVQIAYPGAPKGVAWVYSPLVTLQGSPPIVEPPPTPTPRTTPTIDPTLAAQFIVEIPATRLPTYTPPPPVANPTFAPNTPTSVSEQIPMGLLIIGMGVVGLFGMVISVLRSR